MRPAPTVNLVQLRGTRAGAHATTPGAEGAVFRTNSSYRGHTPRPCPLLEGDPERRETGERDGEGEGEREGEGKMEGERGRERETRE